MNWFTRCLALELAGTRVTANTLHPGEVQNEMWQQIGASAERLSAEGEGFRQWAALVYRSGGPITPPPPLPPYVVEVIRSRKHLL